MTKEVMIEIKQAKYYPEQSSLLIVGVDVETKKPITQQVTVKSFLANTGKFSPEEINQILHDHDRCRLLARSLQERRNPFKLVFEGTIQETK